MVGGDKSFVGIIVTHRRLVKDEAEDACVAERSILSDDKGATFIVQHFMNPSIVYGKPQKRGGMILNMMTFQKHTTCCFSGHILVQST